MPPNKVFQNKSQTFSARNDISGFFITEALQESIMIGAMGVWVLLKSYFTRWAPLSIGATALILFIAFYSSSTNLHLYLLAESISDISQNRLFRALAKLPSSIHFTMISCLLFLPLVIGLGMLARARRTKYQKLFMQCRMTNGLGDTPKLIYTKNINGGREQLFFDSNGLGISDFKNRKEQMASLLRYNIEHIQYGRHQGQVCLTLSKRPFPTKVTYGELLADKLLPKDSFYIGRSPDGVRTKRISDLPHLLIAGTTGSGKSVFFKQVLMGLLESCDHLQMYLIDLKGGLEMIDFKSAPNVQVIKTMPEAVHTLRVVEKEMKRRFAYLEKQSRKSIIPARDHLDRIVVAVDEASVLYMARSRVDPEFQLGIEARKLADSISKLSRAASIHLLLATQKLDKQVIPTSVSENISGRMAFRANSLQGSLVVLGTKDALELPDIAGRGIWQCGNEKAIVQAPFIDEKLIQQRCALIQTMFESGKRKLYSKMLHQLQEAKSTNTTKATYKALGKPRPERK